MTGTTSFTLSFLLFSSLQQNVAESFTPSCMPPVTNERPYSPIALPMAKSGTGMGVASKSKNDSKKGMGMGNTKKKEKSKSKGGSSSSSFDVSKSLMKSEKLYDKIMLESTKAMNALDEMDEMLGVDPSIDITSEYIIAARGKNGMTAPKGNGASAAASDWIPIAQICINRPGHFSGDEAAGSNFVQAAVSYYCREINFAASLAAPSTFKSLPREKIEYSAEPIDSFFRYVYEEVIEGRTKENFVEGGAEVSMTKSKAREILGLEEGCKDSTVIKQAYKKKSFEFHPDRYVNDNDRSQEDVDASSKQFLLVKMAYEALTQGVRGEMKANGSMQSWYESLGGKSRTEFTGPIELISVDKASALCNKAFKSAVVGIDRDLTMAFVARNQAALR